MKRLITRRARLQRGITLIETMATMAILTVGLLAVSLTVLQTVKSNRRSLSQAQASVLAERELESIVAMGCRASALANACANITALDGTERGPFYWTADGAMTDVEPTEPARQYQVLVDVDPPAEDGETGAPAFDGVSPNIINVRVTVRWQEANEDQFEAVALQTRMAP